MTIKEQLNLQEKFNSGGFAKLAKPLTQKERKKLVKTPTIKKEDK